MKQNPPLTLEEAANLTFPCLLEVWDGTRHAPPVYNVIVSLNQYGKVVSMMGSVWQNAAIPSPEITEAMRKQFGIQSEYPKRMLVWDDDESDAEPRMVIEDLGEKAKERYIVVQISNESEFLSGQAYYWTSYAHAKPLPKGEDQLKEQLSELEKQLEIITQQINGIKTQIK